mgnify:CR=1 FL=1
MAKMFLYIKIETINRGILHVQSLNNHTHEYDYKKT